MKKCSLDILLIKDADVSVHRHKNCQCNKSAAEISNPSSIRTCIYEWRAPFHLTSMFLPVCRNSILRSIITGKCGPVIEFNLFWEISDFTDILAEQFLSLVVFRQEESDTKTWLTWMVLITVIYKEGDKSIYCCILDWSKGCCVIWASFCFFVYNFFFLLIYFFILLLFIFLLSVSSSIRITA